MNLHRDTSRTAKTEASIIELKKFPKAILQPLRPIDGLLRRAEASETKNRAMSPEALIITSMVAETDKCTHEAAVSE